MTQIYFDNNASTQPFAEIAAQLPSLPYGNPSSAHDLGRDSRHLINQAKDAFADLIQADPFDDSIHTVFTSGGTESNNWVGAFAKEKGLTVYTTEIEHSSMSTVLKQMEIRTQYLPLDSSGRVDLEFIKENIHSGLLFIHWVNSETGVIQPIEEIAAILENRDTLFAVDAAQAVGKMKLDVDELAIDVLTCSGHKFHSWKGIGVLWSRMKLSPYVYGGGQQGGLRAGTENIPGIFSLKIACEIREKKLDEHIQKMQKIKTYFENKVIENLENVQINFSSAKRVCNTSSVLFEGWNGDGLFSYLTRHQVCVSRGSACLSNSKSPSKVIGILLNKESASSTLRFSFSYVNTVSEVDRVIELLKGF